MRDLRPDLDTLWRASSRLTPARGGRALMFMSANEGEGTSSVAASFSLITAARARKTTWLVDLNLADNPLINAFEERFAEGVGRPGRAYDASLGRMPFFDVTAPGQAHVKPSLPSGKLMAAHQIEGTRLLVTRFRNERLAYGQSVRLTARGDWWDALRRSADWIIVDAPAANVSQAGLKVAGHMDGVVLVVQSDKTDTSAINALKSEIVSVGGHVLGVVMNQMSPGSLRADRLAG